jgi:hypothetical protein
MKHILDASNTFSALAVLSLSLSLSLFLQMGAFNYPLITALLGEKEDIAVMLIQRGADVHVRVRCLSSKAISFFTIYFV